MANCILFCKSSSSGSSDESSPDYPAVDTPQQRIHDELCPFDRLSPLQRPTNYLPLHAWAPPVASGRGPPSSSNLSVGPILKEPVVHIHFLYDLSSEIGSGRFSVTYRCTNLRTGEDLLCKRIKKDQPETTQKRLRNEIKIQHYLSGLPHVIKFERAYEDHDYVYLIMELCHGGELFQRISDRGRLPEGLARKAFRQIIKAVHYCHLMGVMHRDVRPENVVLLDRSNDLAVRLIDFGSARFFKEGKKYRFRPSGNIDYMAPEVLRRSYGKEADVWSAGVLLYVLLSGEHPFPTSDGIPLLQRAIKGGKFDIEREPWPSISDHAKDLVRKMLNTNPKQRITTDEILGHPWAEQSYLPLPVRLPPVFDYFSRLRRIREAKLIRRLGLMMMVQLLPMQSIRDFQQAFRSVSTGNWSISFEDFCNKVFALGLRVTDEELAILMDRDCHVNGASAPFMELMVAMVPSDCYENDQILTSVFEKFREPGTWYIDKKRVEAFTTKYFLRQPREEIVNVALQEVGVDPDRKINKEMFLNIMKEKGEQQSWVNWIANIVQHCIG